MIDATFRICGRDYEALADFMEKVKKLSDLTEVEFVFTISTDESDLPKRIFDVCQKV